MNKENNNKNAEISARITDIIEFLHETPNSFAKKLGYNRAQTIYDIQNMKSAPSYDFFARFVKAGYSALISMDWIFTGKGNMIIDDKSSKQNSIGNNNIQLVNSNGEVHYNNSKEDNIDEIQNYKHIISRQEERIERLLNNQEKLNEQIIILMQRINKT